MKRLTILLAFLLLISGCTGATPLSTEEMEEDFDYLQLTVEENFPYLAMNERKTGVNFEEESAKYRKEIKEGMSEEEFEDLLGEYLSILNNGHTELFYSDEKPWALSAYLSEYDGDSWMKEQVETFRNKRTMKRYGLTKKDFIYKEEELSLKDAGFSGKPGNLSVKLLPGNIGYARIREMIPVEYGEEDREVFEDFLKKHQPKVWIIDLRGNEGGDSTYYTDFFLPYFFTEPTSVKSYLLYKGGKQCRRMLQAMGYSTDGPEVRSPKDLPGDIYEKLPPEKKDFKYVVDFEDEVSPKRDAFTGPVFVLVDRGVFSSAEMMTDFLKRSGRGIVVGERTGGDGLGFDPILFSLPNSGLVVRMPLDYGITDRGEVPEETHTVPDIPVEDARRRENPREDPCIKAVYKYLEESEEKAA